MDDELKSSRTELKRYPMRGHHDFTTIAAILDEAFVCHVGFVTNGQPYVLPMVYGRDDRVLYLHGAASGRLLNALASADAICITVTLVDGLVLARSGMHSSVNYRSVVVLGTAETVDQSEREKALKIVIDHVVPGRWEALRPIKPDELEQTTVLRMDIVEASAKIRTGPPIDDEEDYALPIWAGTLDFPLTKPVAVPDPRLDPGVPVPAHASNWRRPARPDND
ncbi:MAG: pyridoxamine 5'-phosphate oxidase family protein [Betaproteobacteria bacterium]|nr:MAG: pyridoxamine 5'-phosphate oxidase family protein [Betaproteobacteria bacterium]